MEAKEQSKGQSVKVPIREDLFTTPLDDLSQVKLCGSRCQNCGEVFLGKASACGNCAADKLSHLEFSNQATLWSYTVIRYQPPGDYKGSVDPYVPYVLGLVELPEGIRILAPLTERDTDKIKIDMPLKLVVAPLYTDDDGNEVVAFSYMPV
jgi:uncharacterized OB-fold protein